MAEKSTLKTSEKFLLLFDEEVKHLFEDIDDSIDVNDDNDQTLEVHNHVGKFNTIYKEILSLEKKNEDLKKSVEYFRDAIRYDVD